MSSAGSTQPLVAAAGADLVAAWWVQVYGPGAGGTWTPLDGPVEWYGVNAYTALARAICGDVTRVPLVLAPEQIVGVRGPGTALTTYYFTAADVRLIQETLAGLARQLPPS